MKLGIRRAAVVGGGPAGSAAALTLARRGVRVVLLDAGRAGRDKACGDALVHSAVELVRILLGPGVDAHDLGGRPFNRIDLTSAGRLVWRMGLSDETGWVVPRARLDQALRDRVAAEAPVEYEARVEELCPLPSGGFTLALAEAGGARPMEVDGVVLATGAAGGIPRSFGVDGSPTIAASVSAYARGGSPIDAPVFDLDATSRPGYRWVFPMVNGRLNLGVCVLEQGRGRLRDIAGAFAVEWGVENQEGWRGGKGPLWSGVGERWHHLLGVVSCGDAAGLVDPLTGEGITAALRSGAKAGHALATHLLADRDPAPLMEYSAWVQKHFEAAYAFEGSRIAWARLCGIAGPQPTDTAGRRRQPRLPLGLWCD